jgi:hypothetical protein
MQRFSMAALLLIACALMTPNAPAQTNYDTHAAPARPSAAGNAQASDQPPPGADTEEEEGNWAPVLRVTSVEVMRSTHAPELDVIRVRGLSSTDAWENPDLVPLTRGVSPDGVLDLVFVARAPDDAKSPTAFSWLEAIFVIEEGHPYKAVRVRGATNSVLLNKLPGYAEVAALKEDCSSCVGKYFVAKGSTAPAAAGGVVREEDLPPNLRVIKGSEGVKKFDSDPNRLTLILGDDGRIETAVWD